MGNLEPESKLPIARLIIPRKENKDTSAADAGAPRLTLGMFYLFIIGCIAFCLSGFGTFLDGVGPTPLRAFPLYVYCVFLLLHLQRQIILGADTTRVERHIPPIDRYRRWYIFFAALIPLLYAGWARFFGGPANPLTFPLTYVILDLIALTGFGYEIQELVKTRRRVLGRGEDAGSAPPSSTSRPLNADLDLRMQRIAPVFLWASEAASLAIFCIVAGFILQMLGGYVVVPLPFGVHLFSLVYLWQFNLAIGFFAGFGALVFSGSAVFRAYLASGTETARFLEFLGGEFATSVMRGFRSFRVAVSPLIWLIPAFCIAVFAQQVTTFFARAASVGLPNGVGDLFNPFNAANYSADGAIDIALAIISVLCVLGASVASETDTHYGRAALVRFAALGRTLVVFVPIFLLSLMLLNAGLYMTFQSPVPFQLLDATLTTAVIAAMYVGVFSVLDSRKRAAGKSKEGS